MDVYTLSQRVPWLIMESLEEHLLKHKECHSYPYAVAYYAIQWMSNHNKKLKSQLSRFPEARMVFREASSRPVHPFVMQTSFGTYVINSATVPDFNERYSLSRFLYFNSHRAHDLMEVL
jgi:hypothetical protein